MHACVIFLVTNRYLCFSVRRLLDPKCQMLLFSATYTSEVMNFAEIIVHNPLIIRLLKEEESLDNIRQYYIRCKNIDDKYTAITNIYGVITIGQAIIFCHVSILIVSQKLVKPWSVVSREKERERERHERCARVIFSRQKRQPVGWRRK